VGPTYWFCKNLQIVKGFHRKYKIYGRAFYKTNVNLIIVVDQNNQGMIWIHRKYEIYGKSIIITSTKLVICDS